MPEIKTSKDLVWFTYVDGSHGGWCKTTDRFGNIYGHHNRTEWNNNPRHPDPLQYTEILEMADYIPMISKQLEQLMLLYNLNKDDYHGNRKT
jgi:hypothetical protein